MSTSNAPLAPSLTGRIIRSERQGDVYYELERCVGEGGMGRAYFARRNSEEGSTPVVIKVMHPHGGRGSVTPEILAVKEAVALGRLNEQIPPCPFVVRLVDTGSAEIQGNRLSPWLALEYVHGGVEGTTLEDRVTYSLHRTGFGFDLTRAAHFVRCLSAGLTAIHAVSVIHRDLTPGNVLCCGFGEGEIFKISDFGVARPQGLAHTFGPTKVGTPGYLAPDASDPTASSAADVFSFGAVLYYVLTGERYFEAETPAQAMREFLSPTRRKLRDHATLAPELADNPQACEALDAAMARATHIAPTLRTRTAQDFANQTLPWLGGYGMSPHSSRRLLSAVVSSHRPTVELDYRFTVRSRPRDDIVIESAAWDTDGHALALSQGGAWFWAGSTWLDARQLLARLPTPPTFVARHEAGGWLLGGGGPTLSVLDQSGVSDTLQGPAPGIGFSLASGRVGDLLVAVEARPDGPPTLWCSSGRRWLRPVQLEGVAQVVSLQRLDDTRWVLGGRRQGGSGFAALYTPLAGEVTYLPAPALRAFIGGASAAERAVAMLVGSGGVVLRLDGDQPSVSLVSGAPDLAAAAVDVMDCEWATSLGQVFRRDARASEPWRSQWRDPSWRAPFIAMIADVGLVMALTADGGILEGQCL